MNDLRTLGDVDPVTPAELRRLATRGGGPCVSIFLPTHRFRPDVSADPRRLRVLLDEAHDRLRDLGLRSPDAWELLAPHRELLGRLDFWLHQSSGLALFAAPGFHRRYRVPAALDEEVVVGDRFRVRPLLGLPPSDEEFHVLVLSPHRVRLFAATATTFAELPLDAPGTPGIPVDEHSVVALDDPERRSHTRSPLGRSTRLHGHGGDDPPAPAELVRFLAAVDRGVWAALGPVPGPLVVAGVATDAAAFRRTTRRPDLVVGVVPGEPSRLGLRELHDRSLAAAAPALDAARRAALTQVRELPDDRVVVDLRAIAAAAEEGRVDALLVASPAGPAPWAGDALDRAIAGTLGHGGAALHVEPEDLQRSDADPDAAPLRVAAVLRRGG